MLGESGYPTEFLFSPYEIAGRRKKSRRERQLSYGFTHLWNRRNSREISRRSKGRMKGGVNRRGNEPRQTMDPGKQTEGFRWEGWGLG